MIDIGTNWLQKFEELAGVKSVRSAEIRFAADELVTVKMEYLADNELIEGLFLLVDGKRLEEAPKCCSCGCLDDLEYGPDPYAEEIHHNGTDVWECKGCRRESARDI